MASFSNNSHPLRVIDSVFSPNKQNIISGFMDETENNINSNWFYELESLMFVHGDNSNHESTMVDKLENGERIVTLMGKKRRTRNGDTKEGKSKKQKKGNNALKDEKKVCKLAGKKGAKEPPNGYIHVRARSGQATDRHSLAERVRRQKISERMEKLKRMVPGCDQLRGKAVMLDEIINYIQTLEKQVEFLLMKAAALNTTSSMFHGSGVDLQEEMMVNNISSPALPYLQPCKPTQPITFVDTTTVTGNGTGTCTSSIFTPTNNVPLLDTSATLHLQGQMPTASQDYGSLSWEVEDLRQQVLNSFYSY